MTVEEIKEFVRDNMWCNLKYVRVGTDFVFASTEYNPPDHASMVEPGAPVKSAAYLRVYQNHIEIEGWSMSLKIGPTFDDQELLEQLLL